MDKQYNKAITLLIRLIVLNNAGGVSRILKQEGYETKNFIPPGELEAALLQLYMADSDKFFSLMKKIAWNYGDVETNKPEIRNELMKLSGSDPDSQEDKLVWWMKTLDMLSQPAIINSKITNKRKNYFFTFGIIGAIIIILLVILIFKN